MIEKTDDVGHTTFWYSCTEVAKIISMRDNSGKILGRNLFMEMLRQNKVLMSNNFPYQFYINMGFVTMHCVKKWHNHYQPVFSEAFIHYVKKKIDSGEFTFVTKKAPFVNIFKQPDEVF